MENQKIEQISNTQQDEQLVWQSQNGDHLAEAQLLDKYKPLVKAKSRAYFFFFFDSEDSIQEGMIGL